MSEDGDVHNNTPTVPRAPSPPPPAEARIAARLVIADMVPSSQIRECALRDGPLSFANRVIWKGVVDLSAELGSDSSFAAEFPPGALTIWDNEPHDSVQLQAFRLPCGLCHWSLSASWAASLDVLDGTPATDALALHTGEMHLLQRAGQRHERCLAAAATFSASAGLLIRRTPAAAIQECPVLLRSAAPPASAFRGARSPQRATLLLDAAQPDVKQHSGVVSLAGPVLREVVALLDAYAELGPQPAVGVAVELELAAQRAARAAHAHSFLSKHALQDASGAAAFPPQPRWRAAPPQWLRQRNVGGGGVPPPNWFRGPPPTAAVRVVPHVASTRVIRSRTATPVTIIR